MLPRSPRRSRRRRRSPAESESDAAPTCARTSRRLASSAARRRANGTQCNRGKRENSQQLPLRHQCARRMRPHPTNRGARARDPDAWIARIRKLRDDGNAAQARRELREFRDLVPDADKRLPPDLETLESDH